MTGKSLLKQQATINKGTQNITLPLAGLAKGTYIISLDDANGLIANRAIVVQ